MARWWQRLCFAGPAPSHLRPMQAEGESREPNSHELMRSLLECLTPAKPVVLVGNADATRHPGWLLASLGCPLHLLDLRGEGTPRWATEEQIDVSLLGDPAHAPAHAQFVLAEDGAAFDPPPGASVVGLADALQAFREKKVHRPRLGAEGEIPQTFHEPGMLELPRLIASYLADQVPPGNPAVLFGLGRNARRLAHVLRRRGIRIFGLDDSLTSPPDWVADEGIPVHLLRSRDEIPAGAALLMTVQRDEKFLRSLPAGLRVARWSLAGAVLSGQRKDAWHETGLWARQAA